MKNRTFRFGDWQVRPATNTLSNEQTTRQVEPRAMDVLVALCEHPNAVVSAEQLLQECWGNTLYGDNPVHKTITQLRRALGDAAAAPLYIETIRKRGYRTVAEVSYERDEATEVSPTWLDKSPFRGLQAFDSEHAQVFFGRADASHKLLQSLLQQVQAGLALQLVLGPSGSGKTSLVQAGLLPALSPVQGQSGESLRVACAVTCDLGETGAHSLFTVLGGVLLDLEIEARVIFAEASAASLGQRLAQDCPGVIAELRRALETGTEPGSSTRCALFIDRFEAIFSLPQVSEAERQAFLLTLDALARSGSALILIACRNDFYPRIAEYPVLMEGKPRGGHFDLAPPSHAEIAQMIRLPAAAARLSFGIDPQTGNRLDDVLCQSAYGSPDALPLLQYTLQELYDLRTADDELSFAALAQLGGTEGVIGLRAEQAIGRLKDEQRACLPRILSLVVGVSIAEDNITSRRALWSALRNDNERAVVDALVESRLFVSELVGSAAGFGVAHEAILRRWPRVTAWIDEYRDDLRVRERVAMQSARWVSEGKPGDLLLPLGKPLAEAQGLLRLDVFSLSADEVALIRASTQKAKVRDRVRMAVMSTIFALAGLAIILGISAESAKRSAEQRRSEAEGLMGFMLGDFVDKLRPIGKLDLLDSVSGKAMDYLSKSDGGDLNATSLTQRAKALEVIGEVRIARGDPKAALTALSTAKDILTRLHKEAPRDTEVLKNMGANAFWLGQINEDQNNWDQAADYFRQYQDYSDQLNALEPDKPEWWVEQSYAHNSLGSLASKRGNAKVASLEFQKSIELKTHALEKDPHNSTLVSDLADSFSWAGSIEEAQGNLDAAMDLYKREINILDGLFQKSPNESLWAYHLSIALQHEAILSHARGMDEEALSAYRNAHSLLEKLVQQDPNNRNWQRTFAYVKLREQRVTALLPGAKNALSELTKTQDGLKALVNRYPTNVEWSRLNSFADQYIAAALLTEKKYHDAQEKDSEALTILEKLYKQNPDDLNTRVALTEALLLSADIEKSLGNSNISKSQCQRAYDLVQNDGQSSNNFRLLDPWVRANFCLENRNPANIAAKHLESLGYKESAYLQYITNHL